MDNRDVILEVECREPEGSVIRSVRLAKLSFEKLKFFYEKTKDFDTLFNDYIGGNFEAFVSQFIMQDRSGEIFPTGIVWEVDDVGILRLSDISPGLEATAHFTFWDRRLRGRENLVKEMVRYAIEQFKLHRIIVEVPLYAKPILYFVERIGFQKEGREREAVMYKGQWYDVIRYSILDREVL